MDTEWGSISDQEDFADLVDGMSASVDGLTRRPSQRDGCGVAKDGQGADQPKEDVFDDSLELDDCPEFDNIVRRMRSWDQELTNL